MNGTSRKVLPALLVAAVLAACESAAPAAPGPSPSVRSASPSGASSPEVAVAFLQDLSNEGATERALPALQAVELAFETAAISSEEPLQVQVVPFDTEGSAEVATGIAEEITADPRFVAAVAAPELADQAPLVGALSVGGVPVLSLSGRGSVRDPPPGTWIRVVAPVDAAAGVLAETATELRRARTGGVCLVAAPADGTTFARTVRRSLPPEVPVTEVAQVTDVAEAGCGVAIWTGDAEGGAGLATAIAAAGGDGPVLLGGGALRDPAFLELAGAAAEGAISVCPCADVSTSLDLAAQRFIQDFQSEQGSPPGPYAVEAWDAAHLVVTGMREAGPTRSDLVAWLAGRTEVDGLGGRRALASGELVDPRSAVQVFRVLGGRWLEVRGGAGAE